MTDRELMQMALDLLDDINQCSLPPTGIPLPAEIDHVMEALRARLAQPEQPQIVWIDNKQTGNFMNIAPPQQPEQEPVAWMSQGGDVSRSRRYFEEMGFADLIPLYTAPPKIFCGCGDQIMPNDGAECGTCVTARNAVKPEWVGLTDEEKKMAYALYGTMTAEGFVKSLETKLREKNT